MKYHLGCGGNYFLGYVNVDFPQDKHSVADVSIADIHADLLTIKLEPCDEIRSHHVFEHFNYMESLALLVKWTRALTLGGVLRIDLPDMEVLCREFLYSTEKNDPVRVMKIIRLMYGSHEADWAYHINGWTIGTLSFVLGKLGFELRSSNKYGNPGADFPNCGWNMEFIKKRDVNGIENIAKNMLQYYTELPAQQDLLEVFHKEFDRILQSC